MEKFEATVKQWGNSVGITIPADIASEEGLSPNKKVKVFIMAKDKKILRKTFGTLKFKKSTEEIMKESNEELCND